MGYMLSLLIIKLVAECCMGWQDVLHIIVSVAVGLRWML
jgi:hypothetical protein